MALRGWVTPGAVALGETPSPRARGQGSDSTAGSNHTVPAAGRFPDSRIKSIHSA